LEVEELALEGNGLSNESAANQFEGLVGSHAALFEGHAETFELFPLEAEAGAELEATARDEINRRDILCEAHGIVKRHQEHSGYDADPAGTGGDRRGYEQNRGKIPVFDEVMLGQPYIVKPVVLGPRRSDRGFRGRAGRSTGATVPDFGSHTKRVKRIFSLWVLITCLPDLLAAPQCTPTAAFT
jgi:hypothetical protein